MSPNRTATQEAAPRLRREALNEHRSVARGVASPASPASPATVSALAPLVLVAWLTPPPALVESARRLPAESGSRAVTAELADGPSARLEPAPPGAVPRTIEGTAGLWFAHRDERTGELAELPEQQLEALARQRSPAAERAAVVERRLANGAIEIELPEEMASSPLYGWFDEQGELRMGHRPPDSLSGVGAPGVRRGGR